MRAPWLYANARELSAWGRAGLLVSAPLSGAWRIGAALHRAWYERGPAKPVRLPCPVVSVGNLVVGGSGKTPLTAWLARALLARGRRVAVLSRGYGAARTRPAVQVVSDGARTFGVADSVGEEALWLASAAPGVPVLVGRRRDLAGARALAHFGVDLLLLDDGMQHHRLARDVDLVTFHGAAGLGNGLVLPRGPLREGVAALSRADALLVVEGPLPEADAARIKAVTCDIPVFEVQRRVRTLRRMDGAEHRAPDSLAGKEVGVLCGVARPESVCESVRALGARVVSLRAFADHHRYRARDLAGLGAAAPLWVTTEKDAIKIRPGWANQAPLWVLELETQLREPEVFLNWLEAKLEAPAGSASASR